MKIVDNKDRINRPEMEYYRSVYSNSKLWSGELLEGKRILVYMEQGYGDQILFLRYITALKTRKPKQIILHANSGLKRIIENLGVEYFDKWDENIPDHDLHILSFDLPQLCGNQIPLEPYIHVTEKMELLEGSNVGIAWEGNPKHIHNHFRSCPLKHFKKLNGVNLFMLQQTIHTPELTKDCEDMDLNGVELHDFYETAKLINSLDLVVSVDTAVLHLTGAMGVEGFGLLSTVGVDARWNNIWYPSLTLLRGSWEEVIDKVWKSSKFISLVTKK